jgi:gamma-glutamylaminecyclotransferase
MSDRKHIVFVYGTLKRGYGNNRLLSNATFLGEGETEGRFGLYNGSGFPFVSKNASVFSNIRGDVYAINDSELERLDRLEGHPNFYKREQAPVILQNAKSFHRIYAWVYFNPNPRGEENPTGNWDPRGVWPGSNKT